ncbi:MAG: resA 7 [Capsulimonas sp.]|nr:resA 7 [Capsulimonas sp.]
MPKLSSIAALAALTSLSSVTPARADITLTMHASVEGKMKAEYDKMDAKTRAQMDKMLAYQIYISGGKMRTETFMITSLVDLKTGTSYALNTRDKSYYEAPFQLAKAGLLPSVGAQTAGAFQIKDTHETSTMLGHKVRHYVLTSHDAKTNVRMDEYLATDFPAHDMSACKKAGQPLLGVPLKLRMVMSGVGMPVKVDLTIVAKSISTAQIAKDRFVLPAGYTKTDLASIVSGASKLLARGAEAPDFTVYTRDGAPVKLSDYQGKVVMLDFWSTWCGPARSRCRIRSRWPPSIKTKDWSCSASMSGTRKKNFSSGCPRTPVSTRLTS